MKVQSCEIKNLQVNKLNYRGEVGVILFNSSDVPYEIKRGDRVAQLVINRLPAVELCRVLKLDETERGAGGFGSTGK